MDFKGGKWPHGGRALISGEPIVVGVGISKWAKVVLRYTTIATRDEGTPPCPNHPGELSSNVAP